MKAKMATEGGGSPSGGHLDGLLVSPIAAYLERLHARHASITDGRVATYIPALATADPAWFGICLVTADGAIYEAGDTRQPFTIQSISKPLAYGLVLEQHGEAAVRDRVGVEPTGDAFNSISLAPDTGTPFNPMINAGAIAIASLVAGQNGSGPVESVLEAYSGYAGRRLSIDQAVYESESATGHRNRAIAHLLRNAGVIAHDPEQALQLYFQQCSVLVDCRDLAVIAATLANGGVNPLTGRRVARDETVRSVLTVMTSCGMYDFAGEWLYSVGLPAKSGVSGGVLAVLPGQFGIGVFSPLVDPRGNSVRGVRVCQDVSRDLNVHLVQSGGRPALPIRSSYTVSQVGSKRMRSESQRAVLDEVGARAAAFELQGELSFAAAEAVVRVIVGATDTIELAVLDLRRVSRVDASVGPIIADLAGAFAARGGQLALSCPQRHGDFVARLEEALEAAGGALLTFADLDLALEWCEGRLLRASGTELDSSRVELGDHELLRGLGRADAALVERQLRRRRFEPGTLVLRQGEPAGDMLVVVQGHLSVTLNLPDGGTRRLATVSSGMVLGELTLMGGGARTADVRADTAVECYVLSAADLDRLGGIQPALKSTLLENLLRMVSRLGRRLHEQQLLLVG